MDTDHPTALRGFDSYEVRLGDELRGHRATLGKSLLDVQRELRIKASYIDAIENCDASVIPNKGFVPGYVRAYARYLGLEADLIYARFCAESGFVGQTTRANTPGAAPAGGFRLGGGLGASGAAPRRPAADPALSRSHFAAPVGRARPVGLGVSLSDLASVLVLAGLIGGLGYGGWALVKDIQRVDFAPSNETPVTAEAPPNVALPGFDAQAAPGGWPGLDVAPRRDWDPRKEAALAELYAPREIAPPVVELRDGPIAAIDPSSSGLYAGPRVGPHAGAAPLAVASAETGPLQGPAAPATGEAANLSVSLPVASALAGLPAQPPAEAGALVASAGDPTLPRPAPGAPAAALDAAEGVWLVVTDPAWVQVKARDGSILVQRIMESGESWQVPLDEPGAELRAGNAGGVWVQVDGALHGPLGRPGEVVKRISLAPARVAQDWPTAGAPQAISQN
ncbi:helix-turn-helix domain-containing protein [Albimonas pacifica]|uniref:Helix-turn-helix domain-containing protein n=1 Tax=Albimonas pacifica TaxID=1114924 RepID=A0A1I3NTP9_9RHOB|nr:helix-turn-helix domain-containing protein [Albimonas pacifica]SFJ12579.1 Helix-turn-helix domain-containing protein [Albimonas pacifica]